MNAFFDSQENKIYELSKEYLVRKSFSTIEEIVEYISHRLKNDIDFNKNKIEDIVKTLIKKNVLIPGTKLVKEDILTNQTRTKIDNFIKENPGVNINEIMRSNSLGSNQALWHLKFLEKFQMVKSFSFENQRAFFRYDVDSNLQKEIFYLRNDKIKKIIELLEKSQTPLGPTKISELSEMHHQTIKTYLEVLVELEFVKIISESNRTFYELNREYYYQIKESIKAINSDKLEREEKEKVNKLIQEIPKYLDNNQFIEILNLLESTRKNAAQNEFYELAEKIILEMEYVKDKRITYFLDEALITHSKTPKCTIKDIINFIGLKVPDFTFNEAKFKLNLMSRIRHLNINAIINENEIIFRDTVRELPGLIVPPNKDSFQTLKIKAKEDIENFELIKKLKILKFLSALNPYWPHPCLVAVPIASPPPIFCIKSISNSYVIHINPFR